MKRFFFPILLSLASSACASEWGGLNIDQLAGEWDVYDKRSRTIPCRITLSLQYNPNFQGYKVTSRRGCFSLLGRPVVAWRAGEDSIGFVVPKEGTTIRSFVEFSPVPKGAGKISSFTNGRLILKRALRSE